MRNAHGVVGGDDKDSCEVREDEGVLNVAKVGEAMVAKGCLRCLELEGASLVLEAVLSEEVVASPSAYKASGGEER